MILFLTLILPIIVQLIPLVLIRQLCRREKMRKNFKLTILVSFVLTMISVLTIFYAMQISIYGMTLNRPEGKVGCVTGASFFLMTGVVFFVLTFINGVIYSIQSHNNNALHEKS